MNAIPNHCKNKKPNGDVLYVNEKTKGTYIGLNLKDPIPGKMPEM
jgi:hypothetical protein